MDRIDAMRAFVAVVSEGSFSRAAERLDLSPQLVSKYVSRLEQRLGVRLLNRTTRRVHLTEAGTRYCEHAQQILNDIDDMESRLGDWQEGARGWLRISAPVSFSTGHLAPLLCAFQRAHPAIGIDLQLNDRKVDIVEEGVDIALRIGHLKSSALIARRLAPVRLVWCASPDYLARHGVPARPEALIGHRYLRYSYMESETGFSTRERHGDIVCNNGEVLAQAAIAGAGIVLQPTFIVGEAIAAGKLAVIMPEHEPAPMGLYAVYAHRKLLPSKVRCFIDFIGGYFGESPYWDAFD
ncbi:LysR family transcriptional regulator [Oceanisphaera sp. KMM 10153]|uniref:LysR family transcriptional regulator n=1 Tax=Oceanisphaera submarina TaxID=3390193 RepID=UPI003975FBD8